MQTAVARIIEIQLDPSGGIMVWVRCPPGVIPAPGQYCLAQIPGDQQTILPIALMAAGVDQDGFLASPMNSTFPLSWVQGISLSIHGPLGKGFSLPEDLGRLALGACEASIARLTPLAAQAAARGADIAWFTDAVVPPLPAAYELNPIRLLPDALAWADFLVLELNRSRLLDLRRLLGLQPGSHLNCPAHALILTPMPCAGQAECGACAVPTRGGWKLACVDGPVFNLNELEW